MIRDVLIGLAIAGPVEATPGSSLDSIEVALVGPVDAAFRDEVEASVGAALVDLSLASSVRVDSTLVSRRDQIRWALRVRAEQPGVALMWLSELEAGRLELVVLPPGERTLYVRSLAVQPTAIETSELVAAIVRATIFALEAGVRVEGEAEVVPAELVREVLEPTPAVPEPASSPGSAEPEPSTASPSARARAHVRIQLAGVASTFAASSPMHGGPGLGVAVQLRRGATLGVRGAWLLGGGDGLRIDRFPIDLSAGYRLFADRRVGLELAALGRVEVVRWGAQPSPGVALRREQGNYVRVLLGPEVALVARLVGGFGLEVRASAPVSLVDRRLEIDEGQGQRVDIIEAYPVGFSGFAGGFWRF